VSDEFKGFIREIGTKELLGADREKELARRALAGDQRAHQLMVEHNVKLVISIAKKYARMGHDMEDLEQEGTLGLMRAVDKFDPEKGFKFSTYATWWVKQHLQRYVAGPGGNLIKVPGQLARSRRKLKKHMEENESTLEEAAAALEIDLDEAVEALEGPRASVSLDAAAWHGDDEGGKDGRHTTIADPDAPDPELLVIESHPWLRAALDELTEQQRKIVELRWGFEGPMIPQNDVAKALGISKKVVQQESRTAEEMIKRYKLKWENEDAGMGEDAAKAAAVFGAFEEAEGEDQDPYSRGV
jgi:RNA polymerase sigma factor (sigma-70 family)